MANLDALDPEAAEKLPTLMQLKKALYSQKFRSFIQEVGGTETMEGFWFRAEAMEGWKAGSRGSNPTRRG